MYEGVDTVVLNSVLAYYDELPVSWRRMAAEPGAFQLGGIDEANAMLLQACVAMEEQPVHDKHEELTPLARELARLDFKLSVALHLLGRILPVETRGAVAPVKFNSLGAAWRAPGAPVAVGERGLLHIRLRSSLPQTLDLPAAIVAIDAEGWISVRYLHLSEQSAELLQRLCFQRHRRRVAEHRKLRTS